MIDTKQLLTALDRAGIRFATGVPDSLLKDVCACIATDFPAGGHVIATNEGSAVAMSIGHYLASGRPALVYLQNSGLGNIINPLTSLADPQVYGIPMLFMIGWRGEILESGEQVHDEPQHVKQGSATRAQLDVLGIPYVVVDGLADIERVVKELVDLAVARSGPVAMLVRKQAFSRFEFKDSRGDERLLTRETAIQTVLANLPDDVPIVATTGMASREVFEIRKRAAHGHYRDFLTVGGMGHASQIATGIALARKNHKIACIDGDGALLMHMGGLTISAQRPNLLHIVINNGAHDSVGGQPTRALDLDLTIIAKDCGYGLVAHAQSIDQIVTSIHLMLTSHCSGFLEIKCKRGARLDLGRPDRTPRENKTDFMKFIESSNHE